ncbi:MAG: sigma-54-dependent Fis family transcriptional regulator, partial [candidate division Zixibacteria bacterium]|nr:sigma-54-dependent Fis family transcriptional regulator [candidate division Zixibacteria bacterium]
MYLDKKYSILLVDDDEQILEMLELILRKDYSTISTVSGEDAIEVIKQSDNVATVVMDMKMPDIDGIATAREIRIIRPDIPVIFYTGYPYDYNEDDIDNDEKPFDYILKSEPASKLKRSVRNAVESYRLRNDAKMLTHHAESNFGMIGRTTSMQEVYRLINRVAPTDAKIMINGETGTGKELVARAIHNHSCRKDKKLAIFNCDNRPSDLVESELFGHVKGAFTGAISDRVGIFRYANGGTIFLDEIGDLDMTTQTKLLRVLETGEYQPIGSPIVKKTDIRLLCATHKDLAELAGRGKFRQDLYFRLKGIQILIPPLRVRKEDIPLLVEKFKDRMTIEQGLTPKEFDSLAMSVLIKHNWPGNVRELLDTVESLIVLNDSDIIMRDDVLTYLNSGKCNVPTDTVSEMTLAYQTKNFIRQFIIEALAANKGNISAAGRQLGVDPSNLYKK